MSLAFLFFYPLVIDNHSLVRAATYTVTKTEDTNDGTCDADCSLREAVAAANANAGHDTIEFDIPESDDGYIPSSGDTQAYWSIELPSTLELSDEDGVFIDGYSQAGASRNTAPFGDQLTTNLTIQLLLSSTHFGAHITGDNNHIAGLNIQTFRTSTSVITLNGSSNNWFEGNFFGTDITGSEASNGGSFQVLNDSASNIFGTNGDGVGDPGERNLFGGTVTSASAGGYIQLSGGGGNIVSGNYMGTNKTGRSCTAKQLDVGAMQASTSNNQIGTDYDGVSDSEEANLMGCTTSQTPRAFIRLLPGGSNNLIQGNYIGISPHGDALGSLFGLGRGALSMAWDGTSGNIIKGNTISNGATGINCWGDTCTRNTFSDNKIYGNEELDIDLKVGVESGKITFNDPGDIDTGPNDLMNYPEIQGAEWLGNGKYKIWGWLEANLSEAPFTIEVCKSSNHSSGHGGCLESLGTMTTSERMWSMEVTVPGDSEGSLSTFTALATNANGSTSEFGPNFGGSIPGPGAPAPTPKKPDLLATHSGFTVKNDVISFAPPATFLWDVYLDVSHTPQTGTRRVSGAYWQASGIYNAWYKSFFNDAKIMPEVIATPYLLAIKYDPIKLDPNLPEGNLKLAYSQDGEVWKVLPNSVLDMVNKTVAVVTKQGGYYMLVSGYPF